jgi:hypothetical protein
LLARWSSTSKSLTPSPCRSLSSRSRVFHDATLAAMSARQAAFTASSRLMGVATASLSGADSGRAGAGAAVFVAMRAS